jgi:hypothetical protein
VDPSKGKGVSPKGAMTGPEVYARSRYVAWRAFSAASFVTAAQEASRSRAWAVGEPGSAA